MSAPRHGDHCGADERYWPTAKADSALGITAGEPRRYRKRPVEVSAYQWFEVSPYVEGVKRDVDYYRHPPVDPKTGEVSAAANAVRLGRLSHSDPAVPERFRREGCDALMDDHGYIDTLEGGHTVCPGDWIITGVQGERYPCKPDIFAATYEAVLQ